MHAGFDAPAFLAPEFLPAGLESPQGIATLRWSSAGYITRGTDAPPHTAYPPRLLADVEIRQSAFDALALGGTVALTAGEVLLWDADRALGDLARYGLADQRPVRLLTMPVLDGVASDFGQPLSAARLAFSGLARGVELAEGQRARLALGDASDALDVPLQPSRYAGTGGLQGGEALTDRPKPVALGRCFNVTPVFLGNVDIGDGSLPTYQVHWRGVAEIAAVRIRGTAQTLAGSAPTLGQARAWAALGLFQLGSSPDGQVTADVRGDAEGGYVSSTAGVLRRLLGSLGPQLGDGALDPLSWGLAEADLPGEIGWYDPAPAGNAGEAVRRILEGCGAVLCGGRDGLLRLFDPLARATAQFDLDAPHILALRPLALPAALRPFPVATTCAWRPNWSPNGDLRDSVPAAERERLTAEASGPERALGLATLARQARPRDLALPGLYWAQADAAAAAARWQAWIEGGPQAFEVVTDRYLGLVECGHVGQLTWPEFGLDAGVAVVVLGYAEQLAGRRLALTLVTLPE